MPSMLPSAIRSLNLWLDRRWVRRFENALREEFKAWGGAGPEEICVQVKFQHSAWWVPATMPFRKDAWILAPR